MKGRAREGERERERRKEKEGEIKRWTNDCAPDWDNNRGQTEVGWRMEQRGSFWSFHLPVGKTDR